MRALYVLAALSIFIISARCLADPLVLVDDFDTYNPGNLNGAQNGGTGWGEAWAQAFGDATGVDTSKIYTAIAASAGGGNHLDVHGAGSPAGTQNGAYANAARRRIDGEPDSGVVELEFDLRTGDLSNMDQGGDAIDIYVNGVGSSTLSGGNNVSVWLAYRPHSLKATSTADDAHWLLRKGINSEIIWGPEEPDADREDETQWVDSGVSVSSNHDYTVAIRIDLDANRWETWIRDGVVTRHFADLTFFEDNNRTSLAANKVVWAVKEVSDGPAVTAVSIDNIGPITIPEPATGSLLLSGLVAWAARRRYRRRRAA